MNTDTQLGREIVIVSRRCEKTRFVTSDLFFAFIEFFLIGLNVSASNVFVLRTADIVIVNSEINPPKIIAKTSSQTFTFSVS